MRSALLRATIASAWLAALGCGAGSDAGGGAASNPAGKSGSAGGASSPALDPLSPVAELTWPKAPDDLPPCLAGSMAFVPPTLQHAGTISITFSAPLVPLGTNERVKVTILTADGEPDSAYHGRLVWSLPHGAELVTAAELSAGTAEVTLRFAAVGVTGISASLDADPRTGFAEVKVYAPQLPIWQMQIADEDLARLIDNPEGDDRVSATLTIDGVSHTTLVRLHGGSSRYYPKKSFRFDLVDAATNSWGKHLVLRAEYNDKTLLRNWLNLQLFHTGTWLPTPRSQLIHFRVNDRYYGVMNNVERIDGQFFAASGLASTGSLYESDPPLALSSPGGNLTALADPEQYRSVYPHHNGAIDYDDLRKLIEQTLVLPDSTFEAAARRELALDDQLVYLAMMAAIQNQDHIRKNFYLYRDSEDPNAGWQTLPWDLDLTLGHLWSEANDVLEERIVSDGDIFAGVRTTAGGKFYNQLTTRLLGTPAYRARFRELLDHIVATTFTRANAVRLLGNAICRATPDLLADQHKRASDAEYLARVAEIYDFIDARTSYIHTH